MSEERELLALAMRMYGRDGRLLVSKAEDMFGLDQDAVVVAHDEAGEESKESLRRKLAAANARSRGEIR
ncbi:hypothetical protein [Streptomyces sp. 2P-4]|uniref:hypothetical protein n=1 Tax=Streptomyces sp. 2P-4 TaxID=2931974 RepID=UPI00254177A3|nr:hypothetical protein [Streptomyces sp. 2P-4]